MNINNIVYPELRAEMSKKKLTILKMANELNMDRLTLARRLTGKVTLPFDTALEIKRAYFPNTELEMLFEKEVRR